jgi:hypothetical protein
MKKFVLCCGFIGILLSAHAHATSEMYAAFGRDVTDAVAQRVMNPMTQLPYPEEEYPRADALKEVAGDMVKRYMNDMKLTDFILPFGQDSVARHIVETAIGAALTKDVVISAIQRTLQDRELIYANDVKEFVDTNAVRELPWFKFGSSTERVGKRY